MAEARWTELQSRSRASSDSSSSPSSSSRSRSQLHTHTQLHPALSGSIRLKRARTVGSGSGPLLITRRLVGKRPTEKLTQAVQALLSPAKPPFLCVLLYARTSLNLVSPLEMPAGCPGCRPLPPYCLLHASPSARARSQKRVFYLDCSALLWACQCRPSPRTTQSVTQSGCQPLLRSSPSMPEHLGPFAPRGVRVCHPTLFRSSGPGRADINGLEARAGGETGLARRAIGGPMPVCLCFSRPPRLLRNSSHMRGGCQPGRMPS